MSWRKAKIGEIAEVKGGKRLPPGFDVQDEPTQHPYLRVVDFTEDGVNTSTVKFISKEAHERIKRYTISDRDVYVSIAGTIGRVGMVPGGLSGANLTENAAKITNLSESVLPEFLLSFLRSTVGQQTMKSAAGGTSQPKLALFKIADIEVPLPDLPTQQRIAGILSAYDDLIENNRRRIGLLEQAARLLYREWFVHLRFPGHETAKTVDGLPEGWEKTTLGKHCPLIYGKALKAETRVDGPFDVYGSSGIVGTHNKALTTGPAIIVGRKGNVGSVYWARRGFWPIDTVYFVEPANSDFFTYFALQNISFQNTDVAVPGLNRDYAHTREIKLPPKELVQSFNVRATVFLRQAELLSSQNDALTRARDLLLPRLMDGRIPV